MLSKKAMHKAGAVWAIGQGLISTVAPRQSAKFMRKMIGRSFENAEQLEPKPGYLRELRAIGIGLVAAGIAGFAMELAATEDDEEGD